MVYGDGSEVPAWEAGLAANARVPRVSRGWPPDGQHQSGAVALQSMWSKHHLKASKNPSAAKALFGEKVKVNIPSGGLLLVLCFKHFFIC